VNSRRLNAPVITTPYPSKEGNIDIHFKIYNLLKYNGVYIVKILGS